MRKFLLFIVFVIVAALGFLYYRGDMLANTSAEQPTPTAELPACPASLRDTWIGVGSPEQLEFKTLDFRPGFFYPVCPTDVWGELVLIPRETNSSYPRGSYPITYKYAFTGDGNIQIDWNPSRRDGITFIEQYSLEIKDDMLILTDDTGGQFVYVKDSKPLEHKDQDFIRIGPKKLKIFGQLVGPNGIVLSNHFITLIKQPSGPHFEVETRTTDATGHFEFQGIEPGAYYYLIFTFNVEDPAEIPDNSLIRIVKNSRYFGEFILSKNGSQITAKSDYFYVDGSWQTEKNLDFIYPASPPPTITPTPTITSTPMPLQMLPGFLATSTPTP